jgi:ParB/RepB/Spo0J family partition protein
MKLPDNFLCDVNLIDSAVFQPADRMSEKHLRNLSDSIRAGIGLVQPVVVTPTNDGRWALVDGHRRLAVCKKLGWDQVPATKIAANQADAFAQINNTSRKMTGFDTQEIYMIDPQALSQDACKRQRTARKYFGDSFCDYLVNKRLATITSLHQEVKKAMNFLKASPRENMPTPEQVALTCLEVGSAKFSFVRRNANLSEKGKAEQIYSWVDSCQKVRKAS